MSLPETTVKSGVARRCLLAVGILFSAFGAVGAFLPVVPTTPFILLAAACFARSSPALRQRLLANRVFGPYISQWQRDRTVPREAKRKAFGVVVISIAVSIALLDGMWLRGLLGVVGVAQLVVLALLPTTPSSPEIPRPPPWNRL